MKGHAPAPSTTDPLTGNSLPRRPIALLCATLTLTLAIAGVLLVRTAPSLAHGSKAGCASRAARTAAHARGCATRRHRSRAKGKARQHHAKHSNRQSQSQRSAAANVPGAPARPPAVCEDASAPVRESEGSYSCSDGAEPVCANGAEPVAASKGSGAVCPPASKPVIEFSDASCDDGSPPAGAAGGYTCDDGSQPVCEDGSQPVLSDDDATLTCIAYGITGPSPTPSSPGEEESEGAYKGLDVSAS
jgi:hypothetical protein